MNLPDKFPDISEGLRILIVGASGGMGFALVNALLQQDGLVIGAHYATQKDRLIGLEDSDHNVRLFNKYFHSEKECLEMVEEFSRWANGIDALVVCSGGISKSICWTDLEEKDWEHDIFINLSVPFYLSRAAMSRMDNKGRIIFFGTESSLHGGSPTAMAYGAAKMGLECLVKGLAREGAEKDILVNMIRPGLIASGFHQRWQAKKENDLIDRAEMVPLKRAGTPEEVAALTMYLLSDWAGFITGQSLPITGGDWL